MSHWLHGFTVDGEQLTADIAGAIVSGTYTRSMSSTSEMTLNLSDPSGALLQSGILVKAKQSAPSHFKDAAWTRLGQVRALVGGEPFRLRGYQKTGKQVTLTWEPEIATLLGMHSRPVSGSRQDLTRMQFIVRRLLAATGRTIGYDIPDLSIKQKVAKPDRSAAKKGLAKGAQVTLAGRPLDSDQRRNVDLAMQAIEETNAGRNASVALFEACIVEAPNFHNPTGGDSSSVGILQLLNIHLGGSTSTNGGRRDVKLVCKLFLTQGFSGKGGAIDLARQNPAWTPGMIAQACQGSAFPDRYEQNRAEAEAVLDAAGGEGGFIEQVEPYRFHAGSLNGQPETYWQAIVRLCDEVGRRAFIRDNLFVSAFDKDLLKRAPVMMIAEQPTRREQDLGIQPVESIDFDWDINKPVAELTFKARADALECGPGDVVEVVRTGPAAGKWLIDEIPDELGFRDVTVTCVRPSPAKPEPAPTLVVTAAPSQEQADGGVGAATIIAAAQRAYAQRTLYTYRQVRPMPSSLFVNQPASMIAGAPSVTGLLEIDCSSFATLCYKAAGVPDPNGYGYNGQGFTGSLWAQGQRTDTPVPGDLCFYGNPSQTNSHVNVYAGKKNGVEMSYNMGPSAGLSFIPTRTVRTDLHGFRTYSHG